tara:strand:+ start:133 stop:318 length:186 start_codon:yes stop_codon:yes gene_type:complete
MTKSKGWTYRGTVGPSIKNGKFRWSKKNRKRYSLKFNHPEWRDNQYKLEVERVKNIINQDA